MSPARRTKPWLRPVPDAPASTPARAPLGDAEIIEAVVCGDGAVSGELYDRLVTTVDQTLYRVLGRRESDHEDLVQSAFEQIVKTLANRRFAGACSLRTWASSVATHVGLNALRSRRRERGVFDRSEVDAPESTAGIDNPEREATLRRELDRVRAQLAEMSPARAEALLLHDVLGHDLAEIAALTGVSIAAAQSRLVRGRHELMDRMGTGKAGRS
ncbi:MAG: RNA polymerase sigma factor [Myxococcales bacterium]|nr:RNA polymerase sigma factor [Myxococcales bacterium]